jgi:hypothetical protein
VTPYLHMLIVLQFIQVVTTCNMHTKYSVSFNLCCSYICCCVFQLCADIVFVCFTIVAVYFIFRFVLTLYVITVM